MKPAEQKRFERLYQRHLRALKLRGLSQRTVDAYARLLFPNALGTPEQIRCATTHMDRGGAQSAMKAVIDQCGIEKKSRSTLCAIMPSSGLFRVANRNKANRGILCTLNSA